MTPATDEEYDHILAHTPYLCRPLAFAMAGDLRPAAWCLAEYGEDLARPVASISETECGRMRSAVTGRVREVLARSRD